DGHGYSALHCAVHGYHHTPDEATWWNASSDGSDVSATRALLAHGAHPNKAGTNGMTPLLLAVESSYESTPCVEALLEHGADIELAGPGGITPLMRAANAGEAENVRLLLAHNADARRRDRHGHDGAYYAAQHLAQLMKTEGDERGEFDEWRQKSMARAEWCVALVQAALGE
ncbi:MAG: ankyrin repeat domain-containing protein, partial [Caldilineaceae bacterium]|nr:ankyrin repeat domain-containing protein [Caldilineaceae bacterium]